jgi:hypothetical protein
MADVPGPEKTMFFGYPSSPPILQEAISTAAVRINNTGVVIAKTWEDLRGSSTLLIGDITDAIDKADISAFALTNLNPNVMFEVGYAIGAQKHVWLLLDSARDRDGRAWNRFNLLTQVRYVPYSSSDDILQAFLTDLPHEGAKPTIFESVIKPSLDRPAPGRIFFMRSPYDDEASRQIARRIDRKKRERWEVTLADPVESSYTITWYARQVYSASAVIIHLAPPTVASADIHNARGALVGGLALGMKRPVMLVAETDYPTPLDYRELLRRYETGAEAAGFVEDFLQDLRAAERTRPAATAGSTGPELRTLRLGEDVAENEATYLADYFIETASYLDVLQPRVTIFVGRRGTGKTANLLRAAETLGEDVRNLVVTIKPSGYEVEAIARLLSAQAFGDIKSYMIEGLWQYLLETEVGLALVDRAEQRPAGISSGTPEWDLREFLNASPYGMTSEFAVRLESLVHQLSALPTEGESLEASRELILTTLHASTLGELRRHMAPLLSEGDRVCVLIDNLDRAWDKSSNLAQLSELLLGLLVAVGKIDRDFRRAEIHATTSLAVFLRTDIFHHVKAAAREPDKLPASEVIWSDENMLLRLVEARYANTREGASGEEIWEWFISETMAMPTKDYILSRILPRPRDMVHFCNAAVVSAINAGHPRVEEADILRGESAYSQFAYDAIRVENGISIRQLDDILLEFVGGDARLTHDELEGRVRTALGGSDDEVIQAIQRLRDLSFLGLEVDDDSYRYAESSDQARMAEALNDRLREHTGRPVNYEVHPAFRAFLEIRNP